MGWRAIKINQDFIKTIFFKLYVHIEQIVN